MGYPGYPLYPGYPRPSATPQRSAADLTISIILLVVTVVVGAGGGFLGLFELASVNVCPRATCSVEGALSALLIAVGVAALISLAGTIVTIVQLIRQKPAWPFALGTLALCLAALFFGRMAYLVALGG